MRGIQKSDSQLDTAELIITGFRYRGEGVIKGSAVRKLTVSYPIYGALMTLNGNSIIRSYLEIYPQTENSVFFIHDESVVPAPFAELEILQRFSTPRRCVSQMRDNHREIGGVESKLIR